MRAMHRFVIALGLAVGFLGLSGCNTAPPPPGPAQQEALSLDAAKHQESGAKLKPGESKEVSTPFESVIVTKDQSGNVTYKLKGK
jgi:hypothetical protein